MIAAVTAVVTVLATHHAATPNTPKRHGLPVMIDSVTVMRTDAQAGTYVFGRRLGLSRPELLSLNQAQGNPATSVSWFRSRGGVDPFLSSVQLVVEGNADQRTRIINITTTKNCQAPLDGTLFDSPSAGGQPDLPINFDLDSPQSIAQTPDGRDYFPQSTIALNTGEVQVIEITANTKFHYCQFGLQLTVLVGNHTITETVTNHGNPFQVTALYKSTARYHALYVGGLYNEPTGDFVQKIPRSYGNGY